jgi:uncharacterized membrane protein YdjX (TVP38/TMEM64 family)
MRTSSIHTRWQTWAGTLVALLLAWAWINADFSLQDMVTAQRTLTGYYLEHPTLITVLYFAVFTGVTALCLPGAGVLMLVCGGCMGFGVCLLASTAASATGALLTMLFARHVLRGPVHRRLGDRLDEVNTKIEKNEIAYLLGLRLAPVIPFVLFNLLAGLTRVRSWTFLWTSFLGMLPGTALYVNAGHELAKVETLGELISMEVVLSIAALAVVPFLIQWGSKRLQLRKAA